TGHRWSPGRRGAQDATARAATHRHAAGRRRRARRAPHQRASAPLPGVNGPIALATRFAHTYASLVGARAEPVMSFRMFRLDTVTAPRGVPGRLREATATDRDLLIDWSMAFSAEALPQEGRADATSTARLVDARLRRPGAQWLWEVAGEPACTAILSAPVARVERISGVYTPPEKRGRGYASACVAGVSQH